MDPIPITGGPLHFSTSRGHRRHHHYLDTLSRQDFRRADNLRSCDGQLEYVTKIALNWESLLKDRD